MSATESSGSNGSNSSEEVGPAIADMYEMAAAEQYAGLVAREPWASDRGNLLGGPHFKRARHIYMGVLALGRAVSEASLPQTARQILSRAYAQIAWFSIQTKSEQPLGIDAERLLVESLELDDTNAVALYMQGKVAEVKRRPEARELLLKNCRRAVELMPAFPEAWLEIRLAALRAGSGVEKEAGSAERNFEENLGNYRPELFFFDTGYPAENHSISMPPQGEVLARKIYNGSVSRFTIGVDSEGRR